MFNALSQQRVILLLSLLTQVPGSDGGQEGKDKQSCYQLWAEVQAAGPC